VAIVLQALRIRDFRLLWAGGLVSSLGSWLLTLAIPTHIFLVTGSLRATGLTVAAEYLPLLILGPVAGVFADRWDRRRLLIGTNLFCAGSVTVMLLGLAPGRYSRRYRACRAGPRLSSARICPAQSRQLLAGQGVVDAMAGLPDGEGTGRSTARSSQNPRLPQRHRPVALALSTGG
jgi:MFS family permease